MGSLAQMSFYTNMKKKHLNEQFSRYLQKHMAKVKVWRKYERNKKQSKRNKKMDYHTYRHLWHMKQVWTEVGLFENGKKTNVHFGCV